MRFDLAINGMVYGAWKTGKLPLMRDGSQWRPMVHVRDAAWAQIMMLSLEATDDLDHGSRNLSQLDLGAMRNTATGTGSLL